MKKLTKFGIITMSIFALNLVSQSVVQAEGTNSEPDGSNIIDEGGYVNVEGLPAHFSEDGKSIVYNYTVAFKGMHSSMHG